MPITMISVAARLTFQKFTPFIYSQRYSSTSKLFYTKKHEWISIVQDKIGRVGITNYAQDNLGDVVHVQNPDVGTVVKQFDEIGSIESVKAASDLLSPVSGKVVSVNTLLNDKPSLVNTSCYKDGWLFEIQVDDEEELKQLMDEDNYEKYLQSGEA